MKTLTTTNLRSFVYVFWWKFKHHLGSFYFISLLWRQTTWPTIYRCSLIAWMTLNSVMVCPYQRPVLNRSSCQMTEPLLCIIRSCVTYGTAEWNDEWMCFFPLYSGIPARSRAFGKKTWPKRSSVQSSPQAAGKDHQGISGWAGS